MRPTLAINLHVNDFSNNYRLKEELQQFCREHGLSTSGSKDAITNRIKIFLQTGEIVKPQRIRACKSTVLDNELSLETVIVPGHKCSQNVRYFFKKHIPNFHFSTFIQNFFKENIGNTYQDGINAWHEEQQRLKNPLYKKEISPQFEYNQFTRDFYADPANKGKRKKDAIHAWNTKKSQPGDNKYKS